MTGSHIGLFIIPQYHGVNSKSLEFRVYTIPGNDLFVMKGFVKVVGFVPS